MGLPDDYGEEIDPSSVNPNGEIHNPRVLGYDQLKEAVATDYRPFYGDRGSIMNQNCLPRLRHYWHHVEALNRDKAFRSLQGAPFVLRHETLGGGLEYVHPIDEHTQPFSPLFIDQPIPGGLGRCALFPVGQDEGVAEAMFVPPLGAPVPLPLANRFDGLLVVRARVRFRFDGSIAPNVRWQTIFDKFIVRLYNDKHREWVRFALVGGGVSIQPGRLFILTLQSTQSRSFGDCVAWAG